jgi:hypothetical protein
MLEFLRGMVRPAISLLFAIALIMVVTEGIDAPEWFIGLGSGCIVYWFGDRTVTRIKQSKEGK